MPLSKAWTRATSASTTPAGVERRGALLVRQTGAVSLDPLRWGIIPYWREDPERGAPRSLTPLYPLHVNLPMSAWGQTVRSR